MRIRELVDDCRRGDEPIWLSFLVFALGLLALYVLLFIVLPPMD